MPKTATARLSDGRTVTMLVRDDATEEEVRAELAERLGTPPEPPSRFASVVRTLPQVAGAVKGAERGAALGSRLGPYGALAGAVGGAALGGGGAETLLALGQRLVGAPQGQAPILPRAERAAEESAAGEVTGQVLRPVARGIATRAEPVLARLRQAARFGIPAGIGEETAVSLRLPGIGGLAKEQVAAIRTAADKLLDRFGGKETPPEYAARARRSFRAALRSLQGRSPQRGAQFARELTDAFGADLDKAAIAEAVAKRPDVLTPLARQAGAGALRDLQAAWWTTVLQSATDAATGGFNPPRVVAAFQRLGPAGQTALFGARAPLMRDFIATLSEARLAQAEKGLRPLLGWDTVLLATERMLGIPLGRRGLAATLVGPAVVGRLLADPRVGTALLGVADAVSRPGVSRLGPVALQLGARAGGSLLAPP